MYHKYDLYRDFLSNVLGPDLISSPEILQDIRQRYEETHQKYGLKSAMDQALKETDLQGRKVWIYLIVSDAKDVVPLHSHPFYEILFFAQAQGVDYMLDSKRYHIQSGDIMLLPPDVGHRPLFLSEMRAPYVRYSMWLEPAFFQSLCERDPQMELSFQQCRKRGSYMLRPSTNDCVRLAGAIHRLYQEVQEKKPCWEMCLIAEAISLMADISRIYYFQDVVSPLPEHDPRLDSLLGYVDTYLREKITLKDAARCCLMSESAVSHLFREKIGMSFYQYVVQRRLAAVKSAVLQGEPLRSAAVHCGFPDYSSYYRLFKKEFGCSPREFFRLYRVK